MSRRALYIGLFLFLITIIPTIYFIHMNGILKITRTKLFTKLHSNYRPDQLQCLLQANQVFQTINVSWFITFGSALFYHRNRSFDTDDVDTGVFIHDLIPRADRLVPAFSTRGFTLRSIYGSLNDGQEWTFLCPSSNLRFDIFIFYPPLPSDPPSSYFAWWTSSYGNLCNMKRFKKCRWQFSHFTLETIVIEQTSFLICPQSFLVEQYGMNWTIPEAYTYAESLRFLTNMIKE